MDADLSWRTLAGVGFNGHIGPIRFARRDGVQFAALDLDARHMNTGGVCHGGVYMSLADSAMGGAAYEAAGRHPCATIDFDGHFLAAAKEGQTLMVEARVNRVVGGVVFVECDVTAGGRKCFRASGIWKCLGSKSPPAPGQGGAGPESSG